MAEVGQANLSFKEEILKIKQNNEISQLNLKLDQMVIINDLKKSVADHLQMDPSDVGILINKTLLDYQKDTDLEINYLDNASPQERIVHVGKIIFRIQKYVDRKLETSEADELKKVLDDWFQGYIRDFANR